MSVRIPSYIAVATAGWVLLLALSLQTSCVMAANDPSVESGRAALGSHWSHPWYDEATDGVRVIEIEPRDEYSSAGPSSGPLRIEVLVACLAALILGGIAFLLVRAFVKSDQATAIDARGPQRTIDVSRVEHLPVRLAASSADLLAEARRLAAAGQYAHAMVYLFSRHLLELDRLGVIHLARGKTNRQYLREAGRQREHVGLLGESIVAFEEAFFGHHALTRERFEGCLAGVEELIATQARLA